MPIVFAAITPHPPVLIPEIGKENLVKLEKTKAALEKLEKDLYVAKPESFVIISPHGQVMDEDFTINLSPDYTIHFKEFGDFGVELTFKSDYMTIQQIRAADEGQRKMPLALSSNQEIDHGFGVPLSYLTKHLKNIPIIPITNSAQNLQQHFEFGQFLHRQLSKIDKRFAIIASADLSHKLTKDSPGGYSAKAATFDKKIVDLVKKNNLAGVVKIDSALAHAAGECGLRPVAILAGILNGMNTKSEVASYEGPFGVGYMVANFKFE